MVDSLNTRLLYEAKGYPILQNKAYSTYDDALKCPTGDIRIVQNTSTGLIYNDAYNAECVVYDTSYQNEQSYSPFFQRHLDDVAMLIDRYFKQKALVEIGCGKGAFLERLSHQGLEIIGYDAAYEGDDPHIFKQHFNEHVSLNADGIILRHVLEHIPNPYQFLSMIKSANKGKGLIYIEAPCFEWICEHHAFFNIFYEHVNYFRLDDFDRMFDNVLASGRLFGGQYLYVIADLSSLKPPMLSSEQTIFHFPDNFLDCVYLQSQKPSEKSAIWGGASKGTIFSLLMGRQGNHIDMAIDINPSKQGMYLPLTGLKIYSVEEALDRLPEDSLVYVMNSNYLDEIKTMSNNRYQYRCIDYID